jgi:hypothetical protein
LTANIGELKNTGIDFVKFQQLFNTAACVFALPMESFKFGVAKEVSAERGFGNGICKRAAEQERAGV